MTLTAPNDLSTLAAVPASTPEPHRQSEQALMMWQLSQKAQGLTGRSIRERLIVVRRFERDAGRPLLELQRSDLIMWLAGNDQWSTSTRYNRRSILRTFYTWAQDEGLRADNPAARLPQIKTKRREATPFTPAEVQRLLESGMYRRTRLMVLLHYYLGLRVHEIAKVHGRDVDWTARTLEVLGKGDKRITLPIPEALWDHLADLPRDGYWLPNAQPNAKFAAGEGHITGQAVSTTINDAIKRAGLKHRAHDLRAGTATTMHRAGVSAFTIQQAMRHTHADTTTRYLLVDPEEIRDGLGALPALDVPANSRRRPREVP